MTACSCQSGTRIDGARRRVGDATGVAARDGQAFRHPGVQPSEVDGKIIQAAQQEDHGQRRDQPQHEIVEPLCEHS